MTRQSSRPVGGGQAAFAGAFAGRFGPGLEHLMEVLTEDQRASLREAMDGQRQQTRDLLLKLRSARKELFNATLSTNLDEDIVRSKAMEAARLDAELTVLRAKALAQMRPVLSDQQMEKLKSSIPAGPPDTSDESRSRRSNFRRDQNDLPVPGPTPARE